MIFRGCFVTIDSAFKSFNSGLFISKKFSNQKTTRQWKHKIKFKVGGKIDSFEFDIFSGVKTVFFWKKTSKAVTGYFLLTPP